MLTIVKKWCQVHVGVGLGITWHMLTIVNPTRHMLTIVNAKLTCAAMRPQVNNSWHVLTCGALCQAMLACVNKCQHACPCQQLLTCVDKC